MKRLGIDIGTTSVKLVIVDENNQTIEEKFSNDWKLFTVTFLPNLKLPYLKFLFLN